MLKKVIVDRNFSASHWNTFSSGCQPRSILSKLNRHPTSQYHTTHKSSRRKHFLFSRQKLCYFRQWRQESHTSHQFIWTKLYLKSLSIYVASRLYIVHYNLSSLTNFSRMPYRLINTYSFIGLHLFIIQCVASRSLLELHRTSRTTAYVIPHPRVWAA